MTDYPWEPPLAGTEEEAVDGVTGEDPPAGWRPVSGSYRIPGAAG